MEKDGSAILICPICVERVARVRVTPTSELSWRCPNFHRAAREPMSYGAWLALAQRRTEVLSDAS